MRKRNKYVLGFIISVFFTISFLMIVIVGLLDPVQAFYFVQENPLFSWMNPSIGYVVHISGNIFFAVVAIFFALKYWRGYNG